MKFKLTVLTLLVVGLVMVSSFAFAADELVVSLTETNDVTYTMIEATVLTGVPLLKLKIVNTYAATRTISSMKVLNGAGTVAAGADEFLVQAFEDTNGNGILDLADVDLSAATAMGGAAVDAVTTIPLSPVVTIAAGDSAYVIVTANVAVGAVVANTDAIDLYWDQATADALLSDLGAAGATLADTGTALLNAGTITNVPKIAVAATAGTDDVVLAVASNPVVLADTGNKASGVPIVAFSLTSDAVQSHVIDSIVPADGGWTTAADAGADAGDANLYIDLDADGILDATDPLVGVIDLAAVTTPIALGGWTDAVKAPVFIAASETVEFLITLDLNGTAGTVAGGEEDIAIDIDASALPFDNGTAFADAVGGEADIAGALITMVPLKAVLTTVDLTGPPFGRANGIIDAIKLTFTADGSSVDIDDSTVDVTNFTARDAGAGAYTEAFASVYAGDTTDNDVAYIQLADEHSTDNGASDVVADLAYSGVTVVEDESGDYGLPVFLATNAVDAIPPTPLNAVTNDSDGDGYIDYVAIHFSEPLAAASILGYTITGYTVASAGLGQAGVTANLTGLTLGAPFDEANEVLILNLTMADDFDTDAVPAYSYSAAEGVIAGVAGGTNLALATTSFNNLNIPVVDVAAPSLVRASTLDADSDGKFDNLKLWFSEPVVLNSNVANITEADLTDNANAVGDGFDFGTAHTGAYDFSVTGNSGIGTDMLMFPVNEVGALDTAVQPSLEYLAGANSLLTDAAPSANVLAAQAAFTMVADSSLVVSAVTVWLEDSISPQITAAVTLDGSAQGAQNGKLDAIQITFSEPMGADITTYEDLVIAGVTIEADSAVVAGSVVTVALEEDAYNTGLEPAITYSGDTIEDASGAELGSISAVAADNAKPMIVSAVTSDSGVSLGTAANGKIDAMMIMFSEDMNTAKLDDQFASTPNTDGLDDEFSFSGVQAIPDTVEIVDAQNMIIYITEVGGATLDTEVLPQLRYVASGDSSLADMNGYTLDNITTDGGVVETDGAAPIVSLATTVDDDEDGYIDGVALTFNETPEIAADDTAKVLAAITMEELDNAIDLSAAEISASGDIITLIGTSEENEETWDTGLLPWAIIAADNGITDAAENVVSADDSVGVTDGAAPIIGKSIAQTDTKNIVISFSEPVLDETGAALALGDLEFINLAGDSTGVIAIAALSATDSVTYAVTTDSTLADANVMADRISVVAGKVMDTLLPGILAVVDSVVISDVEIPVLVSAETMDVNVDGYIDNIKLTFSEDIKDANLNGFVATEDSLIAIPFTGFVPRWSVEGYDVIGVNLTTSDSAAAMATTKAGADVYNVNDTHSDKILYLSVATTGEKTDTAAAPKLSMAGDNSGGSGVGDYSPNYVASITDYQVVDAAGVAIMDAMMVSATVMEINLSESIKMDEDYPDGLISTAIFNWKIGNQMLEWNANVANVTASVPYGAFGMMRLTLEVVEGQGLKPGMESTIALQAGALKDNSADNVVNLVTATAIDVTPFVDVDVAIESLLPEVFSLSKNFPNPFNPTTTIEYAIPADGAGHVDMVIYNINGQKVRTLVNETQDAGYYNVVWDGRNDSGEMVSSGLYLYKIISGSFNKVEKMTFMK
jgi:hypothetical protein